MPHDLPAHYSSLAPFRDFFTTGVPMITWHKVGPRPRGARLKGLYVSKELFTRQLAELKVEGFTSISPGELPSQPGNEARQIVLTFDDGFRSVWEHALPLLAKGKFKAIQFLVADRIGRRNEWDVAEGEVPEPLMDEAQVRDWLAAGNWIGSHTLTHAALTRVPPALAREEITASRKRLEDLFGVAVEHFCYPYGDWDERVPDLVMEAGYRTACTTEPGINTPVTHRFELKRLTARYPSRKLKHLAGWLRRAVTRK